MSCIIAEHHFSCVTITWQLILPLTTTYNICNPWILPRMERCEQIITHCGFFAGQWKLINNTYDIEIKVAVFTLAYSFVRVMAYRWPMCDPLPTAIIYLEKNYTSYLTSTSRQIDLNIACYNWLLKIQKDVNLQKKTPKRTFFHETFSVKV